MTPTEPRASVRLIKPFAALLKRRATVPTRIYAAIDRADPNARIPLTAVLKLLRGVVLITGDRDIGLRAAREISPDEYDLLEYLAFTASTVRDGLQILGDYVRLLNEASSCNLVSDDDGFAKLVFDCAMPLPPAGVDFQLALAFEAMGRWWRGPLVFDAAVHLRHARPRELRQYQRTFGSAELVFQSSFDGFRFRSSLLDARQPRADPRLHAILQRCADLELSLLRSKPSLTQQVQHVLEEQIAAGRVCADEVAARLDMSRRTLSRRLERDGISFRGLLDDLRKRKAVRHLVDDQLPVTEITKRLGFGDVAAFHRAFKRWFGETPSRYRRGYRQPAARAKRPAPPQGEAEVSKLSAEDRG